MKHLDKLLAALEEISNGGYLKYSKIGICPCVQMYLEEQGVDYDTRYGLGVRLSYIIGEWPKRSKHDVYPVPYEEGLDDLLLARSAYWDAVESNGLWDRATRYGQLRWELLNFCITTLEKEID